MRLTKKTRLDRSIELWEWCAETGKGKCEWPGWDKYGDIRGDCFLCEYAKGHQTEKDGCNCPLYEQDENGYSFCGKNYENWEESDTNKERKFHANLLLIELWELRRELWAN